MKRAIALWSPSIVLAIWAVMALLEVTSPAATFAARLALGVSIGLHIQEEWRR